MDALKLFQQQHNLTKNNKDDNHDSDSQSESKKSSNNNQIKNFSSASSHSPKIKQSKLISKQQTLIKKKTNMSVAKLNNDINKNSNSVSSSHSKSSHSSHSQKSMASSQTQTNTSLTNSKTFQNFKKTFIDSTEELNLLKQLKKVNCQLLKTGYKQVSIKYYFCKTCDPDEKEPICQECSKICHESKGHDISEPKITYNICTCGVSCHNVNEKDSNENNKYDGKCKFSEWSEISGLNVYYEKREVINYINTTSNVNNTNNNENIMRNNSNFRLANLNNSNNILSNINKLILNEKKKTIDNNNIKLNSNLQSEKNQSPPLKSPFSDIDNIESRLTNRLINKDNTLNKETINAKIYENKIIASKLNSISNSNNNNITNNNLITNLNNSSNNNIYNNHLNSNISNQKFMSNNAFSSSLTGENFVKNHTNFTNNSNDYFTKITSKPTKNKTLNNNSNNNNRKVLEYKTTNICLFCINVCEKLYEKSCKMNNKNGVINNVLENKSSHNNVINANYINNANNANISIHRSSLNTNNYATDRKKNSTKNISSHKLIKINNSINNLNTPQNLTNNNTNNLEKDGKESKNAYNTNNTTSPNPNILNNQNQNQSYISELTPNNKINNANYTNSFFYNINNNNKSKYIKQQTRLTTNTVIIDKFNNSPGIINSYRNSASNFENYDINEDQYERNFIDPNYVIFNNEFGEEILSYKKISLNYNNNSNSNRTSNASNNSKYTNEFNNCIPECECKHINHSELKFLIRKINLIMKYPYNNFEYLIEPHIINLFFKSKNSFSLIYYSFFSTLKTLRSSIKEKNFFLDLNFIYSGFSWALNNFFSFSQRLKTDFYFCNEVNQFISHKFIFKILDIAFDTKSLSLWEFKYQFLSIYYKFNFKKDVRSFKGININDISNYNPFQRLLIASDIKHNSKVYKKYFNDDVINIDSGNTAGSSDGFLEILIYFLSKFTYIQDKNHITFDIIRVFLKMIKLYAKFNYLNSYQIDKLCNLTDDIIVKFYEIKRNIMDQSMKETFTYSGVLVVTEIIRIITYISYFYNDQSILNYVSLHKDINKLKFFHSNCEVGIRINKNAINIMNFYRQNSTQLYGNSSLYYGNANNFRFNNINVGNNTIFNNNTTNFLSNALNMSLKPTEKTPNNLNTSNNNLNNKDKTGDFNNKNNKQSNSMLELTHSKLQYILKHTINLINISMSNPENYLIGLRNLLDINKKIYIKYIYGEYYPKEKEFLDETNTIYNSLENTIFKFYNFNSTSIQDTISDSIAIMKDYFDYLNDSYNIVLSEQLSYIDIEEENNNSHGMYIKSNNSSSSNNFANNIDDNFNTNNINKNYYNMNNINKRKESIMNNIHNISNKDIKDLDNNNKNINNYKLITDPFCDYFIENQTEEIKVYVKSKEQYIDYTSTVKNKSNNNINSYDEINKLITQDSFFPLRMKVLLNKSRIFDSLYTLISISKKVFLQKQRTEKSFNKEIEFDMFNLETIYRVLCLYSNNININNTSYVHSNTRTFTHNNKTYSKTTTGIDDNNNKISSNSNINNMNNNDNILNTNNNFSLNNNTNNKSNSSFSNFYNRNMSNLNNKDNLDSNEILRLNFLHFLKHKLHKKTKRMEKNIKNNSNNVLISNNNNNNNIIIDNNSNYAFNINNKRVFNNLDIISEADFNSALASNSNTKSINLTNQLTKMNFDTNNLNNYSNTNSTNNLLNNNSNIRESYKILKSTFKSTNTYKSPYNNKNKSLKTNQTNSPYGYSNQQINEESLLKQNNNNNTNNLNNSNNYHTHTESTPDNEFNNYSDLEKEQENNEIDSDYLVSKLTFIENESNKTKRYLNLPKFNLEKIFLSKNFEASEELVSIILKYIYFFIENNPDNYILIFTEKFKKLIYTIGVSQINPFIEVIIYVLVNSKNKNIVVTDISILIEIINYLIFTIGLEKKLLTAKILLDKILRILQLITEINFINSQITLDCIRQTAKLLFYVNPIFKLYIEYYLKGDSSCNLYDENNYNEENYNNANNLNDSNLVEAVIKEKGFNYINDEPSNNTNKENDINNISNKSSNRTNSLNKSKNSKDNNEIKAFSPEELISFTPTFTSFIQLINLLFDGNATLNENLFLSTLFIKEEFPSILKKRHLNLKLRLELLKFFRANYIDIIIDKEKMREYRSLFINNVCIKSNSSEVLEDTYIHKFFQDLIAINEESNCLTLDSAVIKYELKYFHSIIEESEETSNLVALEYIEEGIILPLYIFLNKFMSIIYTLEGNEYLKLYGVVIYFLKLKQFLMNNKEILVEKKPLVFTSIFPIENVFSRTKKSSILIKDFTVEESKEIMQDLEELTQPLFELFNYKLVYSFFDKHIKKFTMKPKNKDIISLFDKKNLVYEEEEEEEIVSNLTKMDRLKDPYESAILSAIIKYENEKNQLTDSSFVKNLAEVSQNYVLNYRNLALKALLTIISDNNVSEIYKYNSLWNLFRLLQYDTAPTQQEILELYNSNSENINFDLIVNIFLQNLLSLIFSSCNPSSTNSNNEDYYLSILIVKFFKYLCEEHNTEFQKLFFQTLKYDFIKSDQLESEEISECSLFELMISILNKIVFLSKWEKTKFGDNENSISYFYDIFFAIIELCIEMIQGTEKDNLIKLVQMNKNTIDFNKIINSFLISVKPILLNDNNDSFTLYKVRKNIIDFINAFLEEKATPAKLLLNISTIQNPQTIIKCIVNTLKKLYIKLNPEFRLKISEYNNIVFNDVLSDFFDTQFFNDIDFTKNNPEFEFCIVMYQYIKIFAIEFNHEDAGNILNLINTIPVILLKKAVSVMKRHNNNYINNNINSQAIRMNNLEVNNNNKLMSKKKNVFFSNDNEESFSNYNENVYQNYFVVKFFEKISRTVYISENDSVQRVIYTLNPLIPYLSDYSKNEFINEVNRESRYIKLFSLMETAEYFYIEINHVYEKCKDSKILKYFNRINYKDIELTLLLITILINGFLVGYAKINYADEGFIYYKETSSTSGSGTILNNNSNMRYLTDNNYFSFNNYEENANEEIENNDNNYSEIYNKDLYYYSIYSNSNSTSNDYIAESFDYDYNSDNIKNIKNKEINKVSNSNIETYNYYNNLINSNDADSNIYLRYMELNTNSSQTTNIIYYSDNSTMDYNYTDNSKNLFSSEFKVTKEMHNLNESVINTSIIIFAIINIFFNLLMIIIWFYSKYDLYLIIEKKKYFNKNLIKTNQKLSFFELFRIAIYNSIFNKNQINGFIWNVLFSLLGVYTYKNYYFFSIQLLIIVNLSITLKNIVRAITLRYKQMIATSLFVVIILYIYSCIGFYFINKDFEATIESNTENQCNSLLYCFFTHLDYGLRTDGGIGEYIKDIDYQSSPGHFMARFFYDVSFFFIVNVILMSIMFGIVIDNFAELREISYTQENDKLNVCFICGAERSDLEKDNINFNKHLNSDHFLWDYFYYIIGLKFVDQQETNAVNSYVMRLLEIKSISWIPAYVSKE